MERFVIGQAGDHHPRKVTAEDLVEVSLTVAASNHRSSDTSLVGRRGHHPGECDFRAIAPAACADLEVLGSRNTPGNHARSTLGIRSARVRMENHLLEP